MTQMCYPPAAMIYADVETSSDDYASRFSGEAGQWLLSVQADLLCNLIVKHASDAKTLLDVGGGHGQILKAIQASPSLKHLNIEIVGSAPDAQSQIASAIAAGQCKYSVGDLLKLPYPDKSFDIVTSFRLVPHCPEWKVLIAELCRVARCAVLIDYPTAQSLNAMTPLFFAWKKKLEGNTRTYDLFSHSEIARTFAHNSFGKVKRKGEFFWPMVVHRKLKSPQMSSALELPFALTGISDYLGSPVIVCALRD